MNIPSRWTILERDFSALITSAPPLQRKRIEYLRDLAVSLEMIETADELLKVARELSALQKRVERNQRETA